jgi:protein TonB
MSRRSFAGLAVSALLHGALVLAVALVIPRADRVPALFIDLTEDLGQRGAGERASGAPAAPARQIPPGQGRQLGRDTSRRPMLPPRASVDAVAQTAAVEAAPPVAFSPPVELAPSVEPPPPAAEAAGPVPPAPQGSPSGDSEAAVTTREGPGTPDGSTTRADSTHGPQGEGGAPAALAGDGRGTGFGAGPGRELALAVPGGTSGDDRAAYSGYLAHLRRRIQEALRYPAAARRRGLAGTVTVELTILPNGAIGPVAVIQPSAHAVLDEAAVATVRSLRAHPFPTELPARTLTVRLPVVFALQ